MRERPKRACESFVSCVFSINRFCLSSSKVQQIKDGKISLEAELFSLDGKRRFYLKSSNEVNSASLLGKEMGKILKEKSENSYKK